MEVTTSPEDATTPEEIKDLQKMGDAFGRWAKGELSSKDFSKMALSYLESPDWRRRQAAQAAEDLKAWKAGRDRLFELVEKARSDGYLIETRIEPLREGHDSVIVTIEGGFTGFPSYFTAEVIEEGFLDLLKHATARRDKRLSEG